MKNYPWRWSIVMVLFLGITLTGCEESHNDDDDQAADIANVAGTWRLASNDHGDGIMSLTQSEKDVSGTLYIQSETVPIAGTVTVDTITLRVVDDDVTVTLRGTVSDTQITGTWTDTDGGSGIWSATKQ